MASCKIDLNYLNPEAAAVSVFVNILFCGFLQSVVGLPLITGVCVVLKVLYTVQYSNSSTDIVAVMVEFVLGSVTSEMRLDLRQKVSISFSKVLIVDNNSAHCDWSVTDPGLQIRVGGGGEWLLLTYCLIKVCTL